MANMTLLDALNVSITRTKTYIDAELAKKANSSHTHNYAGSSSAGGAANSVKTNLVVKLNGGSTEGTNLFTFNGSTAKTVNITPSAIGAAASSHTHSYLPLTGGSVSGAITKTGGSGAGFVVANGTSRTMVFASQNLGEHIFGGSNDSTTQVTDFLRVGVNKLTYETGGNVYNVYHAGNKPSASAIGAAPTSHASTATTYGAASASNYGHAMASSTTPKANGTAAVGSETAKFARGDHVHPLQTTVSGNAGSATKVNNNLVVKLNSGTTEGTNLFTFNGSAAKTINITPSAIGAAASSHTHNYAGSSSAGGAANSVKTNLIIKLNGGSTEGTNLFTFNGSTAKTVNITPSSIGAAPTSHASTATTYGAASASNYGHAMASSTTPKANGTAAVGSETAKFARGDHVHPLQTTVSGNAGSATKLANARTLTIGNTGKTFNGTANVTWTASEMGVVRGNNMTATTAATSQWYRVASTTTNGYGAQIGMFFIKGKVGSNHCHALVTVGTSHGQNPTIQQLAYTRWTSGALTKARIVYLVENSSTTAHLEVYSKIAQALPIEVEMIGANGWVLVDPNTVGSIPEGYNNKEITFVPDKIIANFQGPLVGNADSATKLATTRAIKIGNKSINFDGSAAITYTLSDIGAAASSHTHSYAGSSSAGGAATSANKVNSNLVVKLNGGSTEGTNLFTFNGSAAKTINITPSAIGAAPTSHASTATTYGASSASNYGHAMASSTTPKANGTAAVGSETAKFARGDHVHPLQTTVSGNAGTATKLATARTLTIGNTGKTFNGSANVSWTLAEIGAVAMMGDTELTTMLDEVFGTTGA